MDMILDFLWKLPGYIGTAAFVVFFFGFCIFIHELGHFLVAKWRGLHIVAFSIGFKKIWSFTRGGVEYRIGCIPCGGYVDLPQIDATGEPKTEDGKVLPKAKPIDRMLTAFAGPFFNVLFGFALATVVWYFGLPMDTPRMKEIKVAEIEENSPEHDAGLRKGDIIYKINGKTFNETWHGVVKEILFTIGNVTLDVKRGDKTLKFSYKPKANPKVMPNEKIGYPFFKPKIPVIVNPKPDSPAAQAGLKEGDEIVKVNGKDIVDFQTFEVKSVNECDGKPLKLDVLRGQKDVELTVYPDVVEEGYRIGISYDPRAGKSHFLIRDVFADTPAAEAGIKKGDILYAVNGHVLKTHQDVKEYINNSDGKALDVAVMRNGHEVKLKMTPKKFKIYTIGVEYLILNPELFHPTPWYQFVNVIDLTYKSVRGMAYFFLGKSTIKPSNMSGPLGIIRVISVAVYRGSIVRGLHIIVLITFSLALLNLMPLPVLDGGHITFAFIEMIIGRPLPARLIMPITYVFVALLIGMMIFVTYYDFARVVNDFTPKDQSGDEQAAAESTETDSQKVGAVPTKDDVEKGKANEPAAQESPGAALPAPAPAH